MKKAVILLVAVLGCGPAFAQISYEAASAALEAGRAALTREDWSAALAGFERARGHRDLEAAALYFTGVAYEQLDDPDSAAQAYSTALGLNQAGALPRPVAAAIQDRIMVLAHTEAETQDLPGAEQLLSAVAAMSSRHDIYESLAEVQFRQGKWTEAAATSRRLLSAQPHNFRGWWYLTRSETERAASGAEDAVTAARDAEAALADLPFLLNDLHLGDPAPSHVLQAEVLNVSAPEGSQCIIEFSLSMDKGNWRAPARITLPPPEGTVSLRAEAVSTSYQPAPPPSAPVYSVSYTSAYCEAPGQATTHPPGASAHDLKACPATVRDARALLSGRPPFGKLENRNSHWQNDHAYPAGGIRLFGEAITRLSGEGDISGSYPTRFYFGLTGPYTDHLKTFRRAHGKGENASCYEGVECLALEMNERGNAVTATLIQTGWAERSRPEGTYLKCSYED